MPEDSQLSLNTGTTSKKRATKKKKVRDKERWNPLFDAMREACRIDDRMTATFSARFCKAVDELYDIDATAEQIAIRANVYCDTYGRALLTPQALVANWNSLRRRETPEPFSHH